VVTLFMWFPFTPLLVLLPRSTPTWFTMCVWLAVAGALARFNHLYLVTWGNAGTMIETYRVESPAHRWGGFFLYVLLWLTVPLLLFVAILYLVGVR